MGLIETFLLCFTPLFVIINPFGTVPAFLSLTEAYRKNRVQIAMKVTLTAFLILAFFGLTGLELFKLLGVTIPAFKIAGGIILITVAFDMIKGETKKLHSSHYDADDISIMPLAIPLLSGPGAITTMVVLMYEYPGTIVFSALIICMLLTLIILSASFWVLRVIKERGLRVMVKILGIILCAEAVQFMISGVLDIIKTYF